MYLFWSVFYAATSDFIPTLQHNIIPWCQQYLCTTHINYLHFYFCNFLLFIISMLYIVFITMTASLVFSSSVRPFLPWTTTNLSFIIHNVFSCIILYSQVYYFLPPLEFLLSKIFFLFCPNFTVFTYFYKAFHFRLISEFYSIILCGSITFSYCSLLQWPYACLYYHSPV